MLFPFVSSVQRVSNLHFQEGVFIHCIHWGDNCPPFTVPLCPDLPSDTHCPWMLLEAVRRHWIHTNQNTLHMHRKTMSLQFHVRSLVTLHGSSRKLWPPYQGSSWESSHPVGASSFPAALQWGAPAFSSTPLMNCQFIKSSRNSQVQHLVTIILPRNAILTQILWYLFLSDMDSPPIGIFPFFIPSC